MRHRIAVRLFLSRLRALLAVSACMVWAMGPAFAQIEAPVRPRPAATTQAPAKTGFRAVSYEVFASIVPESQRLTARVVVEFQAQQSSRTVECQLHPDLTIAGVRDSSGNSLSADRSGQDGLDVSISLPNVVPAGQTTKLTFDYGGVLSSDTPIAGVRLASIAKDGAYLLLPARWFPLTDYPANRFTGVFHIEVPQNFAVVGTGTSQAPAPASSQAEPAPSPMPSPTLGNRNPEGAAPRLARRNQDAAYPAPATKAAPPRRPRLPRPVPRPRVRESRTRFASINRRLPEPSLPARCNFLPCRPRD